MQEAIDRWQTMPTEELHRNIRQLQVSSEQYHTFLWVERGFEQTRFL